MHPKRSANMGALVSRERCRTQTVAVRHPAGTALVAAWLAATLPGAAFGCGYHVELAGGVTTAHAASIPVALAVHDGIGSGRLERLADVPPALAVLRANGALRMLAAMLEPGTATMPAVAVVLVEAHLWSRIVPASAGTQLQFHADGPAPGDVVVVTGEPALRALLDGRMSWEAAIASGLVVIEGPAEGRGQLARHLARQST